MRRRQRNHDFTPLEHRLELLPHGLSGLSGLGGLSGLFGSGGFVPPTPVPAPTLTSSTVAPNGTTLTETFSEAVNCTSAAGHTFTDGSTRTLVYVSGSGTTSLVFTIGTTVNMGDSCTLAYLATAGNIVASGYGNAPLATFGATSVTNDSTQGSGGGSPSLDFSQAANSQYINLIWG